MPVIQRPLFRIPEHFVSSRDHLKLFCSFFVILENMSAKLKRRAVRREWVGQGERARERMHAGAQSESREEL